MKFGIKYCGGCNSRYDRVALAKKIESQKKITFEAAKPEKEYDEIHVFCGCTARCADTGNLKADKIIIYDNAYIKDYE